MVKPMSSRLIVAQLAAGSPPGLLRPWSHGRGIDLDVVRADLGEPLPRVADACGIALIGADASVGDDWLSWMAPVRAWAAEALAIDVPLLGIGLGAQLMASVLGAELRRLPEPHVGLVHVASEDPAIASGPWVSYTQDEIAHRGATAWDARGTQAFRAGPHLGLHFQAHATPDMVRGWARDGRFAVPDELADDMTERITALAHNARTLFSDWAAGAGLSSATHALPTEVLW